ncbi:MAG TPA: hypothetical protein VEZ11_08930 [Thermoanaerobaculia bacterium]|nr:hypothetical protein [Thermoanaerobaculia bacterium]
MTQFPDLANPQRRALEVVTEVAIEKECKPFLVGGPVRDLLLGRHVFDIDLTLEDGASTLARALAKHIGGRVRSFPQFMTYKIFAEDLPEIDIATARKERYRVPGALPTVSEGKLKDDLLRRDFTINAMAFGLLDNAVHDPAGGEKDLNDRLIRVLHEGSFADDPTRIFRAIRLARRLGFLLEPATDELLRTAIEQDALASVSKERIWRELFFAMDEAEAPAVLADLLRRGALRILIGPREADSQLAARLESLSAAIAADTTLDRYILYTSALLDPASRPQQMEGSGFSQKRLRIVLHIANDLPRFEHDLAHAATDRQRFRLFKAVSPEMLAALEIHRPEERETIERFRQYRAFKLALRGSDLDVPPGPHVAKALERTREAVFNGEIAAADARAFAQEVALKYLKREQRTEIT